MICGVTYAPFASHGSLNTKKAQQSLQLLQRHTAANWVVLVPVGYQNTPFSTQINFANDETASDEELLQTIQSAKKLGLKVALKPTVNCRNGMWRAHINFFDNDVPCEPKWSDWFAAYTNFQLHYAKIAQQSGCDMLIAGCEMVCAQRRETEWRIMLQKIRKVYQGLLSYNTDKYQEENVPFWDAVDIISSSGYYPVNDWENQLDRIEKVVKKEQKPFFFAEVGCMSCENSWQTPNNWELVGQVNMQQQALWYSAMFAACAKRDWVRGYAVWDWPAQLYLPEKARIDQGYSVYKKPSSDIIKAEYIKMQTNITEKGEI